MPVTLDTHAVEQGTYHLVCTFTDEDDVSVIPTTIVWTLSTRGGSVVNGRSDVSVASPATAVTITLQGTDLSLVEGEGKERLFLVEWTYNSSYGSGMPGKEQATFTIDDLKMVS